MRHPPSAVGSSTPSPTESCTALDCTSSLAPPMAQSVAPPLGRTVELGGHRHRPSRKLHVYHWNASNASSSSSSPAIIVLYHGFLAHGHYPTVRYAAESLAAAGYTVIAADLPGHGRSEGLRGYLPPPDELVDLGVHVADYARSLTGNPPAKLFLMGSSLGGAMALAVAHQLQQEEEEERQSLSATTNNTATTLAGVILLAPMLQLAIDTPTRYLLQGLAGLAPTWQVIPSSSTSMEKQYRDPQKRKECETDPLAVSGSTIRIGSAHTCVELARRVGEPSFAPGLAVPCLVMVATEDTVVHPQGARDFYQHCAATDKTLHEYAALHGLLCEPKPLCDQIHKDLLEWIQQRT